jgi:transmembrane 9 superfamily protein 2/4
VESGQQYCATGFPMGCYVDAKGQAKDACVISREYNKADTYYVFNHVDIVISYRSGSQEDWGKFLAEENEAGGRIVCE